ncbi:hypothetical protein Q5692_24615 [Microcoleus sp. C2C3]|uniref:hypothetical protein n=1 Tax=unclassified Microcoleus TaxID=2642155 RepID=UPI002FD47D88
MTNTDLGLEVIPHRPRSKSRDGLIFVIAMWFLSRSVIAIGMQVIAPWFDPLPNSQSFVPGPLPGSQRFVPGFIPKSGWELFAHWDGQWYTDIATVGYTYVNDGQAHTVAF